MMGGASIGRGMRSLMNLAAIPPEKYLDQPCSENVTFSKIWGIFFRSGISTEVVEEAFIQNAQIMGSM